MKLLLLRLLSVFLVGVNLSGDKLVIAPLLISGAIGLDLDLSFDLLSDPGAELLSWLSFAVIDGNSCGGKWISLVLNIVRLLSEYIAKLSSIRENLLNGVDGSVTLRILTVWPISSILLARYLEVNQCMISVCLLLS